MEEKVSMTIKDLNDAISQAVNEALNAREGKNKGRLLNREETAKRLHVNVSTLWRWQRSGYFCGKKLGARVWYSLESIERLERGERTE